MIDLGSAVLIIRQHYIIKYAVNIFIKITFKKRFDFFFAQITFYLIDKISDKQKIQYFKKEYRKNEYH